MGNNRSKYTAKVEIYHPLNDVSDSEMDYSYFDNITDEELTRIARAAIKNVTYNYASIE